jgi:hypothetical protein
MMIISGALAGMKLYNKANKDNRRSTSRTVPAGIEFKYFEKRLKQHLTPLMGGVAMSLSVLLVGGQAKAASFTFTKVAESTDSFFPLSAPALNNNGTIAFVAALEYISNQDFLSVTHQGLFTITDGTLTQIADTYSSFHTFETFAINDSGTVAFGAESDERIQGIFTSSGGVITPIINANEPFSYELNGLDLNESGTIVFYRNSGFYFYSGIPAGIYTSLNGTLSPLLTVFGFGPFFGIPPYPTINDSGTVAFQANDSIYTTNGGGTFTSVIDPTSFISLDSFVSINNSGTVVFAGDFTTEPGNVYTSAGGVYTARDGSLTTIATNDSFLDFYSVAINDRDTVVFLAEMGGGIGGGIGLFTGSDPITDKVIAMGDEFFGSTITYLSFNREGLNNSDQIAFYAQLANGTSGIYLAERESEPQPVPEPSSVLSLLSVAAWAAYSQRKCQR